MLVHEFLFQVRWFAFDCKSEASNALYAMAAKAAKIAGFFDLADCSEEGLEEDYESARELAHLDYEAQADLEFHNGLHRDGYHA